MPWKVVADHSACPSSKPFAVIKKPDGKKVGCHTSRKRANAQLAALNASEGKMTKPIEEVNDEFRPVEHEKKPMSLATGETGDNIPGVKLEESEVATAPQGASDNGKSDVEEKSTEDKSIHHPLSYVPWGITSFGELAAFEEAREKSFEISEKAALFPDMVMNIMASEDIKDKQKAIRKAGEEFADMVKNIHEDDDEDKKEIEEQSNIKVNVNITKDSTETEGLTNDLSLIARLKDKVVDVFRKEEEPKEVPSSKFMIWKEKDGTYRWIAVYSNNYRDEDVPVPEIISEKSHLNFVEKVRSGDYPYPTLRHYHIPGTDWGQANFVDYQKDTGFALAAGYVLPGHEQEAEFIQQMDDIALSHGMKEVEKDPADPSIIIQHRTFEISDLPRSVAANKLTNFYMVEKEKSMTLNSETKEYLGNLGFTDERLSELEKELDKSQKDAEDQGIERKEAESKEASADDSDNRKSDIAQSAFSEAQSVELKAVFEVLVKNQNEQLITLLTPIAESIKKLEAVEDSEEKRLKKIVELSPPATLEAFMFGDNGWKGQSVAESFETIIEGGKRTKEGKDGPKEAEEKNEKRIMNTGDAWADSLINGVLSEKTEEFEGIN